VASFLALLLVPAVAAAAPLVPDLKPLGSGAIQLCQEKPTALFHKDACKGTGRTVIRTTTKTGNSGRGPLELLAVPRAEDIPEDCHGDGDVDINGDGVPDDNDVLVRQRIYNDANGNGVFERSVDTTSASYFVGCRYYHAIHHHYHLEAFVKFKLVSAQTGQQVRGNDKVSFCINDTGSFDLSLPGAQQPSSGHGHYSAADCVPRDSTQGVSIGWNDTYGWKTPGQEIDVTGLPVGDYCVLTQADPENHLMESDEGNNVRQVRYHIDPTKAPVNSSLALKQVPGGCPAPAAAANTRSSTASADRRFADLRWSSPADAASVSKPSPARAGFDTKPSLARAVSVANFPLFCHAFTVRRAS
jgi:hypothetical protein